MVPTSYSGQMEAVVNPPLRIPAWRGSPYFVKAEVVAAVLGYDLTCPICGGNMHLCDCAKNYKPKEPTK